MRPQILYPLFASSEKLKRIGEKTHKLITNFVGSKIIDLIWHLPSNIIDRRNSPSLSNAKSGEIITIKVKVIEHSVPKNSKQPYKVLCSDGSEEITLVFFKVYASSIAKNLPVDSERIISGKIDIFNNQIQMTHPDYILPLSRINEAMRVEAIYPLSAGLGNRLISQACQEGITYAPKFDEWLDENHLKSMNWTSFNDSLHKAHNPQSFEDLEPTSPHRSRLAYDELLANQLALGIVRSRVRKSKGNKINGNGLLRKKILEKLPFKLTDSQEKVLKEIYSDMEGEFRMHRLLQGDVGSGKTIVAFLSALNAIETGFQSAIMAPTEILSKQHLETMKPLCEIIDIKVELLTGRIKGKKRQKILEDLKAGKIDLLIGTHALFVESVEFQNLGFLVIDEQHRFGVHQRLALSNKGNKTDILVMTATPIPRTLILTAYGDMEYSKIDQSPMGRKPTTTSVMPLDKISQIIKSLEKPLKEEKQIYWVCPLVEESEKLDLAAAIERFEHLKKVFGNQVGLVHGRMKEKEKDEVMEKFRKSDIKILVATTVIEVGVNIPKATIMIIEHAERFGLAQLHQLRGRVKRGYEASNCILLYNTPLGENARARLNIIRDSEDGFEIAEKDLEIRGSGEVLGTKQSGFAEFKLANMSVHQGLLLTANKDSKMILEMDPNLKTKRGENLRTLLYLFEQDSSIKTYLAG